MLKCFNVLKEMKILLAATVIGLFLASAVAFTQAYAENVQNEIAENVIRFHVLANSGSAEDIELKNYVRDGVLARFPLDPDVGIEGARQHLLANLTEIEEYAAYLVQSRGFDYPVYGVVGQTFFPTRTYNDLAFPAGIYEAMRIIIGEGRGGNWWCVMFPPLCYVDAASPAMDDAVSENTLALMNHSQNGAGVTVRFKVVEWWQERMHQPNLTHYLAHYFGYNQVEVVEGQ